MTKARHFRVGSSGPGIAAALLASIALTANVQRPEAGSVITVSRNFPPGVYRLRSVDAAHPALTVRGSDLTLDFKGVTLRGASDTADPDSFTGVAVFVDGGQNVTIRNLTARGYKIGVLAKQTKHLRILNSDVSYNWKARLYSLVEHESLVDWLSYHHNDADEWIEQGAGIYLAGTDGAEVSGTRIVQGQNGLMLARSTNAKVWNNTFSYLSGVGLGLYRSSGNVIEHNRIDYCVRGYSEGFYNRGQDSAGILVYEQSSRNVIAFNSVTHSGDGFFLWAGQSTMDSGQGGADDNIVYRNDFSFAPTNGIEATFSRNVFVDNLVEGNWHGVWGGYSHDSLIGGNRFVKNVEAIAIEHGQSNRIDGNSFDADGTALHLWRNSSQDPTWGYPKHHDTRSRDDDVVRNTFSGNTVAMQLGGVDRLFASDNRFVNVTTVVSQTPDAGIAPDGTSGDLPGHPLPAIHFEKPRPFPGMTASVPALAPRRARDAIIVDEWGPYDWLSPKLWPDGRSDARPLKLRILGPSGAWRVSSIRGATLSAARGRIPGEIVVAPTSPCADGAPDSCCSTNSCPEDFDIELTYVGARVVSPRGEVTRAGEPYTFGYRSFFVPADWTVTYYAHEGEGEIIGAPIKVEHRNRLDFMSGRAIADGVPADNIAMRAEADVTLPVGAYTLRTISDDGVRVTLDGARVIDHWASHESAVDTARLTGGKHHITVEYYEKEGFAELRFDILKGAR
jgi:parallel beta-helix repeat protein